MIKRLLITLTALAASVFGQSGFAVVVGKANPATEITKVQLRRMVTGEMKSWPAGGKVQVVLATVGDPARVAMLKEVCGMSESDFARFLAQKSFGGDSGAPKVLPSAAVVLRVVELMPGSVGIVATGEVSAAVKALPLN